MNCQSLLEFRMGFQCRNEAVRVVASKEVSDSYLGIHSIGLCNDCADRYLRSDSGPGYRELSRASADAWFVHHS